MYNMQWTTSCVDVLNEALFGQFLPFDFYRSTPSKQPVDKRLGWLLSDSANTSIGSDFSHNSDIRSVLQSFVFKHNFKETNFCCFIVPVFQNSKWIVPYSEVFWLCESERCRCCKLVCVKNVSSNMVWSGWILSAKNMLQAALSTYYVASTSMRTTADERLVTVSVRRLLNFEECLEFVRLFWNGLIASEALQASKPFWHS